MSLAACGSPQSSSVDSTTSTIVPNTVSSLSVTTTVRVSTTSTPAPSDTTAQAKALAFAAAGMSLSQALSVPPGDIAQSTRAPSLPNASMVLEWEGGSAEIDITGRILMVIQDPLPLGASTRVLSESELSQAADQAAQMLGWDGLTLADAGFTVGQSGIVSQTNPAYLRRWTGYDTSGVVNDGLVELRLDARDARILGFFFHLGPGAVDISGAISREQAVYLAELELAQTAVQPTTTEPGQTSLPHTGMAVEETLKVTDAPAVTGGKTMLVWVIHLTGWIGDRFISGTAYLDAKTGDVLVSLSDG